MNFYQKTISIITIAVIVTTLAIALVCIGAPHTGVFIAECFAIVLGELILGATLVGLTKESDRVLPYSIGACGISSAYLLFALVMLIPAALGSQPNYFILAHVIGLIIAGISYGIFVLGKHNIGEQEKQQVIWLKNKKSFFLRMSEVYEAARLAIPDEKVTLSESAKIMDNLRYAADSIPGMERIDQDILDVLTAMKTAISGTNAIEYKQQLAQIKLLYLARENQAKLGRSSIQ